MVEPGEHGALAPEPLSAEPVQQGQVQQLDRGGSVIPPIAPAAEPDGAHPTAAEGPLERVGAKALASQAWQLRREALASAGDEELARI